MKVLTPELINGFWHLINNSGKRATSRRALAYFFRVHIYWPLRFFNGLSFLKISINNLLLNQLWETFCLRSGTGNLFFLHLKVLFSQVGVTSKFLNSMNFFAMAVIACYLNVNSQIYHRRNLNSGYQNLNTDVCYYTF